jgi:hypothetical protein
MPLNSGFLRAGFTGGGAYGMRRKKSLAGFVTVSIAVVLSIAAVGQNRTPAQARKAQPNFVSMVALLASPQKYDGTLIRVVGVLGIEPESNALYLHQEDYEFGLTKNSFSLRLTEEQENKFHVLDKKHVIVEGMFFANGLEARGMTAGAIFGIYRLEGWRTSGDVKVNSRSLLRRRRVGVVDAASWVGTNLDHLSALASVHDYRLGHLVTGFLNG